MLGEWFDALAILAIVILNGALGFVQDGSAEQALAALRKLSSPHAKTFRDGHLQNLLAAELVPADRIDLEPGDRVPADVRLLNTSGFRAEKAALTGESVRGGQGPSRESGRTGAVEGAACVFSR